MTSNIIDLLQRKLGYPPLKKVDPNIQETRGNLESTVEEKLAQSAIPVVLGGFFSFTRTDQGCYTIINGTKDANWLSQIFGSHEEEAVEKVAHYAGVPREDAGIDMKQAARETFTQIKDAAGTKPTVEKIKAYMSNQRHNILVHLPAAMQLGYLLNDNAMDDRTNKMEGPVSSFMHSIENKLSGGGE